jgi:hypothetical protein
VQVTGSADVDVSVNRLQARLAINLVNTSGPHWDKKNPLTDSIPPVGPLAVVIRTTKPPTRITLEPGGQTLPFEYREGEVRLTVPQLDIHRVVIVQ